MVTTFVERKPGAILDGANIGSLDNYLSKHVACEGLVKVRLTVDELKEIDARAMLLHH